MNDQHAAQTADEDDLAGGAAVIPLFSADPFLDIDRAAEYIGVPKATLYTWRTRRPGYGPRATKTGARLRYRLSELDRWLAAHTEDDPALALADQDPGPSDQPGAAAGVDQDHQRGRHPRPKQPEVRMRRSKSRMG